MVKNVILCSRLLQLPVILHVRMVCVWPTIPVTALKATVEIHVQIKVCTTDHHDVVVLQYVHAGLLFTTVTEGGHSRSLSVYGKM